MYTITNNEQYNSIEVFFDSKPASEVLTSLKAMKMRWNAKKACWYGFASREQIESAIEGQTIEEKPKPKETASKPAKAKEDKPAKRSHNVKVGDVFYTSWGYEQTNVNFFQVIELRGASSALIREVYLPIKEEEAVSGMSANRSYEIPSCVLPPATYASFVEDQQNGDLHRIHVSKYDGKPYIKVGKPGHYQETAIPYDGKKVYESWYY